MAILVNIEAAKLGEYEEFIYSILPSWTSDKPLDAEAGLPSVMQVQSRVWIIIPTLLAKSACADRRDFSYSSSRNHFHTPDCLV